MAGLLNPKDNINAGTARPQHVSSAAGVDKWFQPGLNPGEGTGFAAQDLNAIMAQLRIAASNFGVSPAEGDDAALMKAMQAAALSSAPIYKVVSRTVTAPPVAPAVGDTYLVPAAGATGAWAGKASQIAVWNGSDWFYPTVAEGALAWLTAEKTMLTYVGSVWSEGFNAAPSPAQTGFLLNPTGRIKQRPAGALADGQTGHDCWYALTQSGPVTPSTLADVESGLPSMMRLLNNHTAGQRAGYAQIISTQNSRQLRSKVLTLFGKMRNSGNGTAQSTRFAILEWTGTPDAVPRDVVSNWASTSFTTGGFFLASTLVVAGAGVIAVGGNVLSPFSLSASISAACNNVIVLIWSGSLLAAGTGTFDLTAQLILGGLPDKVMESRPYALEEQLCRTYFEIKTVPTINGAAVIPLVPKRAAPVVTVDVGTASGITRDGFRLTHNAEIACTITANAELGL